MEAEARERRELEEDMRTGDRARRIRAALSDHHRRGDAGVLRRRSAGALASSRARPHAARPVHRAGGGKRPDRPARRVDPAQGVPDAATWPPHIKLAVNLSPAQFEHGDLLAVLRSALGAVRACSRAAGAGDHRDRAGREERGKSRHSARDQEPRRLHRARRFRHRLFVACNICRCSRSTRSRSTSPSSRA